MSRKWEISCALGFGLIIFSWCGIAREQGESTREWKQSLGYRIEAPGRVVVIAGDTSPAESIVENCQGCDVLIAEAYTQASFDLTSAHWKKYRRAYHPSTRELAELATRAKPALLVLTHRGNAGCDQSQAVGCLDAGSEEQMLKEMKQYYNGNVVAAHDLDVFSGAHGKVSRTGPLRE